MGGMEESGEEKAADGELKKQTEIEAKVEKEEEYEYDEDEEMRDSEDDGLIYLQDAIYRKAEPSELLAALPGGKNNRNSNDLNTMPVSTSPFPASKKDIERLNAIKELDAVTNLAEKYEQYLYSQLEEGDDISSFLEKEDEEESETSLT